MAEVDLHGHTVDEALRIFIDVSNRHQGNPGVTIVFPRKILPTPQNQLAADILAFCSIPRTKSKIAGEFRKNSALEIKEAIRTLVRQGQLKIAAKGDRETYVTVT